MRSHPAYKWTSWFYLIVALLVSGCGSDGPGVTVATGTQLPATVEPASIRLISELERSRAVPEVITAIRLVGQDAQGVAVYSQTRDKAEEIVYQNVPPTVVLVRVEYLADNTLVGLAVAEVQLIPGEEYLLSGLEFEDVGTILSSLTITPTAPSIAAGTTQQFTATGTRITGGELDLSDLVRWSSESENVATINSAGLARGLTPGQVQISAEFGSITASADLTVTDAVPTELEITPSPAQIPLGIDQTFVAMATFSDQTVQDVSDSATWSSSNEAVATMNGAVAESLTTGNTLVRASLGGVDSPAAGLTVTDPVLASLRIVQGDTLNTPGTSRDFDVVGVFTDGSEFDFNSRVTFSSDNPSIVSVASDTGLASMDGTIGQSTQITADDTQSDLSTSVDVFLGRYLYVSVSNDQTDTANPRKIKAYSINSTNGELTEIDEEIVPNNPQKVSVHPSGRFVYLARTGGGDNFIEIYSVNLSDGTLTPAGSVEGTTTGLADVKVSFDGRFLFAGYTAERVESYRIDQETGLPTLIAAQTPNPNPFGEFPAAMFAHPSLPFVYASALQSGLYGYAYSDSSLTGTPGSRYRGTYGGQGPFLYANNLAATLGGEFVFAPNTSSVGRGVVTFSLDDSNGRLTQESWFQTPESPEVVALDPDETTLFAIRGLDRLIYTFDIASDGSLSLATTTSITSGAGRPREVVIDRLGQFMHVAGDGSQTLIPIQIDRTTKALTFGTPVQDTVTVDLVLSP